MKRALVALLLPLALVASGCGGADAFAPEAVAQAADRTAAKRSARFEMAMQMTVPGVPKPVRFFASGAFDYEQQRGRVDLDMSELAAFAGAPGGEVKMSMIFDLPVMYMRVPTQALGAQGAPPTPWIKIDLSKAAGMDLGQLSQLSQNPADQMQMLRAVSDDVEKRGEREVRGVPTTHYHAEVDLEKALAQGLANVPPENREAAKRALESLKGQTGLASIPIDVFLDAEGVVRRMLMDMEVTPPQGGDDQTFRMLMTMDLFDFGTRVDVRPPPASEVTDMTAEALAGLQGRN